MTTTARDVVAGALRADNHQALTDADAILAALAADPDALLAWVREAVPGVVVFVDGPEVRERVAKAMQPHVEGAEAAWHECCTDVVIAALTTGGAT